MYVPRVLEFPTENQKYMKLHPGTAQRRESISSILCTFAHSRVNTRSACSGMCFYFRIYNRFCVATHVGRRHLRGVVWASRKHTALVCSRALHKSALTLVLLCVLCCGGSWCACSVPLLCDGVWVYVCVHREFCPMLRHTHTQPLTVDSPPAGMLHIL